MHPFHLLARPLPHSFNDALPHTFIPSRIRPFFKLPGHSNASCHSCNSIFMGPLTDPSILFVPSLIGLLCNPLIINALPAITDSLPLSLRYSLIHSLTSHLLKH